LHKHALDIRVKTFGEEHPDVARSYGALGLVFSQQPSRWSEAKAMHRRALAIRIKTFGTWHPEVARSHGHLGSLLRQQGRFRVAEWEFRRSLKIRALVYRSDSAELASVFRELGKLYQLIGREAEAAIAFKCADNSEPSQYRKFESVRLASVAKLELNRGTSPTSASTGVDTTLAANSASCLNCWGFLARPAAAAVAAAAGGRPALH